MLVDHLLKTEKGYKNLKKEGIHDIFIKKIFQHHMAYGDFKDLPRRKGSNNNLCDKAFHNAKNPKYDGYQKFL